MEVDTLNPKFSNNNKLIKFIAITSSIIDIAASYIWTS